MPADIKWESGSYCSGHHTFDGAAGGTPELVAAGLLRSAPGPGGGYRLGRPVARITLVEAVDGPIRGEAPLAREGRHGLDSRLGPSARRSPTACAGS